MKTLILFALMVLVSYCGEKAHEPEPTPTPSPSPTASPTPDKEVVVNLFAATYCEPCKKELPELQRRLESVTKNVRVSVYVIDAKTQEKAKAFGDALGLKFLMKYDPKNPGGSCTFYYAYYFPEVESCSVPAAVVDDIRLYPGQATVDKIMRLING